MLAYIELRLIYAAFEVLDMGWAFWVILSMAAVIYLFGRGAHD